MTSALPVWVRSLVLAAIAISGIAVLGLCGPGGIALAQPSAVGPVANPRNSDQIDQAARESATNQAALQVREAERARSRIAAEKAEIARRYEAQLQEIDKLKQRRPSWSRDRQIKTRLSDSLATARRLTALDARLRRSDGQLAKRRQVMLDAIGHELEGARRARVRVSSARRTRLIEWRREAERALRRVKKIVLPDDRIDPLSDPEELEYQASLLAQSERQLERELTSLARQATRFERMAKLRRKRARADELGRFDDNEPRRGVTRNGDRGLEASDDNAQGGAESPAEPTGQPAPPSTDGSDPDPLDPGGPGGPGPDDSPMFEGDPVLVLSEVVDAGTLEALRTAEQSGDPAVKARAARRAQDQIRRRLDRLRDQRGQIERRARKLRRE